jgi:HipA-like C-terminal domain
MISAVNPSSAPESLQALSPLAMQITALLSANASLSAAELQKATAKSQPSISLAIGELGDRVCKIGAARSTRYALTKDILGLPATQTLHFTDEGGSVKYFGELTQLQNRQIVVRANTKKQWISAAGELPWFLKPLRPQGFLGRQYLQLRPDFPGDPESWSAEQALYIAANHQSDPPGAFGIGQIEGRLVPEAPLKIDARALHYDQLAQQIGQTLPAGSSAGGEQPKFLTEVAEKNAYQHLIVKFSPPRDTPFGIRWRALLHLENLAQATLSAHGIAAAKARIIESPNRTYSESPRFDRIGMAGKRHVVAIEALHGEFIGANSSRRTWLHTAATLADKKIITRNDLSSIAKIYAFGQYIGNADMHFGNLSFFIDDVEKPTPLLAPVYDMLPMMWRPGVHSGELDVTAVREPPALLTYAREQAEAREWAIEFWRQGAKLDATDPSLRAACEESAVRLGSSFRHA